MDQFQREIFSPDCSLLYSAVIKSSTITHRETDRFLATSGIHRVSSTFHYRHMVSPFNDQLGKIVDDFTRVTLGLWNLNS